MITNQNNISLTVLKTQHLAGTKWSYRIFHNPYNLLLLDPF